uniref:Uncharacterized protein n=1 Tax=Rhizophora mucronata TaxID=61149 RepID=A0A2P2Q341_RHIMU
MDVKYLGLKHFVPRNADQFYCQCVVQLVQFSIQLEC